MKRWNTTQQMANDIAALDKTQESKELNISQCNMIAKSIKNLYANGGEHLVLNHLYEVMPSFPYDSAGLTVDQKNRVMVIVKKLFRYHWFPFSRIRANMIRISGNKK